jgi:hypothetical protein
MTNPLRRYCLPALLAAVLPLHACSPGEPALTAPPAPRLELASCTDSVASAMNGVDDATGCRHDSMKNSISNIR